MNSKLDQNKHLKKKWKKTFFDSLETENSYLNVGYWKLKLNRIDQIVCFILFLYKYLNCTQLIVFICPVFFNF